MHAQLVKLNFIIYQLQGWARDLKARNGDETETLPGLSETRPEISSRETETRPLIGLETSRGRDVSV